MKKLTVNRLKQLGVCGDAILVYSRYVRDHGEVQEAKAVRLLLDGEHKNLHWANWLLPRLLTHENQVRYAVNAAKSVLELFEKQFPNDERPRKAIEAAESWLANPCQETAYAADAAASAVGDAGRYAGYAAVVVDAACYAAAYAATYAACYAAAYAATDRDKALTGFISYGLTLLEGQEVRG